MPRLSRNDAVYATRERKKVRTCWYSELQGWGTGSPTDPRAIADFPG